MRRKRLRIARRSVSAARRSIAMRSFCSAARRSARPCATRALRRARGSASSCPIALNISRSCSAPGSLGWRWRRSMPAASEGTGLYHRQLRSFGAVHRYRGRSVAAGQRRRCRRRGVSRDACDGAVRSSAGTGRARRQCVAVLHQRHDRLPEGRDADPSQPLQHDDELSCRHRACR